jgi:hypothetical protein
MRCSQRLEPCAAGADSPSAAPRTRGQTLAFWCPDGRCLILPSKQITRALVAVMVAGMQIFTACAPAVPAASPTTAAAGVLPTATATAQPTPTVTPSYEDPYEPNDSMLDASGPLVPGQEYEGYISGKNDADFFYLEIDSPRIVRLSLTDMPSDADYDLYLVTGEEDILSESANSGQAEEHIEFTTSSVGVFYVLVLPFHNFSGTESYTLKLELSPVPTPSGEDSYEPNDTLAQAAGPLVPGQPVQSYIWDEGDLDVYFFDVDQSTTMAVMLTDIPPEGHYGILLYNGAGDEMASATRALSYATIQEPLAQGTYFVAVLSFSGFSKEEPYTLEINSVTP